MNDDRVKLKRLSELTKDSYLRQLNAAFKQKTPIDRAALVYIHGFNVSFEEAALRAGQLGSDLGIRGETVFYSWPSKGSVLSYNADEATIEASEDSIAEFLTVFATQSGAEQVHIIAHSMGNRGLLRAVNRIREQAERVSRIRFGQIILAAPDVDQQLFTKLAHCYPRISDRTTLYVSEKDKALRSSGIIHDFPRAGYTPPVTIVPYIDTVEVSNIDLTILGHGFFADARDVLYDMHQLLSHNAPPRDRMGLLKETVPTNEVYWRIHA